VQVEVQLRAPLDDQRAAPPAQRAHVGVDLQLGALFQDDPRPPGALIVADVKVELQLRPAVRAQRFGSGL
jgi:hypothetical protein